MKDLRYYESKSFMIVMIRTWTDSNPHNKLFAQLNINPANWEYLVKNYLLLKVVSKLLQTFTLVTWEWEWSDDNIICKDGSPDPSV